MKTHTSGWNWYKRIWFNKISNIQRFSVMRKLLNLENVPWTTSTSFETDFTTICKGLHISWTKGMGIINNLFLAFTRLCKLKNKLLWKLRLRCVSKNNYWTMSNKFVYFMDNFMFSISAVQEKNCVHVMGFLITLINFTGRVFTVKKHNSHFVFRSSHVVLMVVGDHSQNVGGTLKDP